jgi:uncharacterized membrane protein (DUF373 family)
MGDIKSAVAGLLVFALCMAAIGYVVYEGWTYFTDQLSARRLEREAEVANARAREAEAEIARLRATTDLANARAAIEKAQGEADALRRQAEAAAKVVEAGARTIDRQSFITMIYGILTPWGVLLALGLAIVSGLAIGALGMLVGVLLTKTGPAQDTEGFVRAYLRKQAKRVYHKK